MDHSMMMMLNSFVTTRKKIKIYLGVDIKNSYYLIVSFNKKSRILMKDAKELLEFLDKMVKIKNINFKYKKG